MAAAPRKTFEFLNIRIVRATYTRYINKSFLYGVKNINKCNSSFTLTRRKLRDEKLERGKLHSKCVKYEMST